MVNEYEVFDGELIRDMFANYLMGAHPEDTTTEDALMECMNSEKYQQEFLELVRREL
tara:strand:- start:281 stop:451 length:171 start_codon:yes stop_codon:yes gene_type:complete